MDSRIKSKLTLSASVSSLMRQAMALDMLRILGLGIDDTHNRHNCVQLYEPGIKRTLKGYL